MRKALAKKLETMELEMHDGPCPIGMGGVWVMKQGQMKVHVMPEYASDPLTSDEDVENWLRFYSMDAPFTCYSVFVSRDPVRKIRNAKKKAKKQG